MLALEVLVKSGSYLKYPKKIHFLFVLYLFGYFATSFHIHHQLFDLKYSVWILFFWPIQHSRKALQIKAKSLLVAYRRIPLY